MSREYYSVDLPRTCSPFATTQAIQQAILSYSSETEQDIVPHPVKQPSVSSVKSKDSKKLKSEPVSVSPTSPKPKESLLASLSRHNSTAKRASKIESRPKLETIESYVEKPKSSPKPKPPVPLFDNEDIFEASTIPSKTAIESEQPIGVKFGLSELPEDEFTSYTIWNASYSNMRVCPLNLTGGDYYYVENRSFIPNRPGVTLRLGTEKKAPCVAAAHLDYFKNSNMLGLGNMEHAPASVRWERLHKDSFWTHMRYSFSFEWEDGVVKKYEWHRTKNIYWVQDQGNLVLVEEGKHDVMAQYKGKEFAQVQKQRGALDVRKMDGERAVAWERMVILSWAVIVELQRRRTRERRVQTLFGRIV